MKQMVLALALLLGGTAVAHANPPGLTEPGPAPIAPYAQQEVGPRGGHRGEMMRGQRGQRGPRMKMKHRLPPQVRAKLVAMFDRDQDGRLDKREQRAAKRFVKRVIKRRAHARHGGPQGGGPQGF